MAFPLSADHRYSGDFEWRRGDVLCAVWMATDTVVCTASVWHLAAISLDRLAVSEHNQNEQERQGSTFFLTFTVMCWGISFVYICDLKV